MQSSVCTLMRRSAAQSPGSCSGRSRATAPGLCARSGSPGDEAADLHRLPRSEASRALRIPPSRARIESEGQVWPAGGQPAGETSRGPLRRHAQPEKDVTAALTSEASPWAAPADRLSLEQAHRASLALERGWWGSELAGGPGDVVPGQEGPGCPEEGSGADAKCLAGKRGETPGGQTGVSHHEGSSCSLCAPSRKRSVTSDIQHIFLFC